MDGYSKPEAYATILKLGTNFISLGNCGMNIIIVEATATQRPVIAYFRNRDDCVTGYLETRKSFMVMGSLRSAPNRYGSAPVPSTGIISKL